MLRMARCCRQKLSISITGRAMSGSKNSRQGPVKRPFREEPAQPSRQHQHGDDKSNSSTKVRLLPMIVGGITVYAAGLSISLYYFNDSSKTCTHVTESERRKAYDVGAVNYEKEVCASEAWMGIFELRRKILSKATGDVLEVAAGIGVNLIKNLYPGTCCVTCTDCSLAMVNVANSQLEGKGNGQGGIDARVEKVAVMDADRLEYPDQRFDTVVDTFGLCSFEDPIATLKEMQRVCKVKGKILLLEHGRSYLPPVNYLLDWSAHKHALRWGCYWNRDILQIVEASGLKVVELERKHLGTTYVIVLERER